jgi:hypothetical protein
MATPAWRATLAVTQLPDAQAERRGLIQRVLALDPMIEQTLGESSHARYRSSISQNVIAAAVRR